MVDIENPDAIPKYKIIFLGDQSTGKSSIINRFVNNQFDTTYQATIGLDFLSKNVQIGDQDVRLLLYDTAGQEKFRSLIPMYIRDAQIVFFVYDITRRDSFDNIPKWFTDVLELKTTEAIYVLIGNKIDLNSERTVKEDEGKKFAMEKNILFQEVSAKTGDNFENLFYENVFEAIDQKFRPSEHIYREESQGQVLQDIQKTDKSKKKKMCC